jgi:hypothetical protein
MFLLQFYLTELGMEEGRGRKWYNLGRQNNNKKENLL